MAGAVEAVSSSFGIMLYQYTASWIEQCVFVIICFIVRWNLSIIPFTNGTWAHWKHRRTPHIFANCANLSPQNAAQLSVSSSLSSVLSQKNCFQLFDDAGRVLVLQWLPKGKWLGPQSISGRWSWFPKWVTSILTLLQFSDTSSLSSFQCTGARSINRHSLQSLTTCTAALRTLGFTNFTKYSVCFMPECLLDRWMACIRVTSSSLATAYTVSLGSLTVWISYSHCHGTLVSWSAW